MHEVHVTARSVEPFAEILGNERVRSLESEAQALRGLLGQRTVWNVNTAASGGGVAEMLRSFLRYARGLDIDVRWLVFEGPPEFFRITKRVHNALHGSRWRRLAARTRAGRGLRSRHEPRTPSLSTRS